MDNAAEKAKKRRQRKLRYSRRLKKRLCPHCGGPREDWGIIGCNSCNAKNDERRVRLYDRKKKCIYQKRLMDRRRREGFCPVCGQSRDNPNLKICSKCRQCGRASYYRRRNVRLEANKRRYYLHHKPKPLCQICLRHFQRCACGKYMKPHHGRDSCLFTCSCGKEIYTSKEG